MYNTVNYIHQLTISPVHVLYFSILIFYFEKNPMSKQIRKFVNHGQIVGSKALSHSISCEPRDCCFSVDN